MKPCDTKWAAITRVLPLILIVFGHIVINTNGFRPATVEAETCPRPDLFPAPTPVISQQPTLAEVEAVLTNQANLYNWPDWILKTIAKNETNWRQVDRSQGSPSDCEAGEGEAACTCVSPTQDYGLMQLNWPVHHTRMDWAKVQGDYVYNIERGADVLAASVAITTVNTGDLSATGEPGEPINWYLKFWGYNGYTNINNPARFNPNRHWDDETGERILCQKENELYTYQEKIFYKARCEANIDDTIYWEAIDQFPLPDDALFTNDIVRNRGPKQDILIFKVQTTPVCLNQSATFQYTLATTQSITTQITIRSQSPWSTTTFIKRLPPGLNEWDGTDESGQPVPPARYWFTVAVTNTQNQLVGSQSGPVEVGCHQTYVPALLKHQADLHDTYEPNNSLEEAYPISPDITYTTYIWNSGDVDWFRVGVTVPVGKERLVEVWLTSIPPQTDYDLEIYDPTGNRLAHSRNGGNLDEYLSLVATASDTYYVRVYPFGDVYSQTDGYQLRVAIGPAVVPRP